MSLYDQSINQASSLDPKEFSNRYRNVTTGTMYDTQIRTTTLTATVKNEDGSETRTALNNEQAINVFTAWCKQKAQDGQFNATLEQAMVKAGAALARTTQVRTIGNLSVEEAQTRLQNDVMRVFLGCFPQIPTKFNMNGTQYELIMTSERYYARGWVMPDEDYEGPTIRASEINRKTELGYYYDPELIADRWAKFKDQFDIMVVPKTGNGLPGLSVKGQLRIYYIPAADISIEGARNIMHW